MCVAKQENNYKTTILHLCRDMLRPSDLLSMIQMRQIGNRPLEPIEKERLEPGIII